MVLLLLSIYGSKVILIEEDIDVEGGIDVDVKESGTREGERDKRIDRWAVRRVFRAEVRVVSLSKPGKLGELIF